MTRYTSIQRNGLDVLAALAELQALEALEALGAARMPATPAAPPEHPAGRGVRDNRLARCAARAWCLLRPVARVPGRRPGRLRPPDAPLRPGTPA